GRYSKCTDQQFRIQQYLQNEHYALWEVIEFGDSYEVPVSTASATITDSTSGETGKKLGRTVTLTAEDMQKKKNDQYGNFKAEGSETLEQTFNRLQVIVGQLQFMDVEIEHDDINQKFLTSLAPEWRMHTIVWRNRSDLDTMSLDDLKHISRNEDSNTASIPTASTNVPTASASVATISQDTACAYIAFQSSGSQIKFEDINQIDEEDMEEMDIKWNMALLSMRADKFWKKTGKKISIQGSDVAGFDKSKVECFNCHKMGYFARECRAPRSQDRGRRDTYRRGSKAEEQAQKALMAIDGVGWDWSYMANDGEDHALVADEEAPTEFTLMTNTNTESKITDHTDKLFDAKNMIYHYKLGLAQVESRLVEHKDREIKYGEKIKGLEFRAESNNECIEILKKKLEILKKENEGVDGKLGGFLTASKNLDNLIESQRADKNKDGLGYSAIPPPPAQIYSSAKKDLSWTGLPEFADDTVTDYSRPSPTMESTSSDDQNRNPSVSETKASPSAITPKPFIKFVKASDSPTESKIDKAKKSPVKYAEQYSKTNKKTNVRGNQRNWNNLKSHQLGLDFVMKKKACFNCGGFNRLAYDCRKRVKKGTSRYQDDTHKSFTPRPCYWDSGCSRHMTCNISYLSDYEPFDGGYVSFGQGGCKITGKGTIKTSKVEFESVYFVKDLKDFKLLDDANILLRTPMQHSMYSINLNNIVTHRDLTCLVAKASADECILWHRRLSHLNFKTMNKLVRHNLGKFKEKGDKGYFIGYSMSSKAFRVFNKRTRRVEENLHVEFLENKATEKGSGPNWLFDIDSLTKSMNYVPVDAGTISTNRSGTKDATSKAAKKDESFLRYIALPNWAHDALLEYSSSKPQDHCSTKVPEGSGNPNPTASTSNPPTDQMETLTVETPIPTVSSPVPTAYFTDSQFQN
nr:hypothetical protein [Tanacetum cinerariifolium]